MDASRKETIHTQLSGIDFRLGLETPHRDSKNALDSQTEDVITCTVRVKWVRGREEMATGDNANEGEKRDESD